LVESEFSSPLDSEEGLSFLSLSLSPFYGYERPPGKGVEEDEGKRGPLSPSLAVVRRW